MSNETPCVIDATTGEASPIPPQIKACRYRANLNTVHNVRKEMSKVYRESRSGLLDVADLTKLIYCLNIIGKTIETSDLEARIEKLENES